MAKFVGVCTSGLNGGYSCVYSSNVMDVIATEVEAMPLAEGTIFNRSKI